MKKGYTKYEYIYIYSKLGVVTGTFAAVSISLSLFLGFCDYISRPCSSRSVKSNLSSPVCSESACRASQYQAL